MSQLRFSADHSSRYTSTELRIMMQMTTDLLHSLTRHLRQISIPPHLPLKTSSIDIDARIPSVTPTHPLRIPTLLHALTEDYSLLHEFADSLLELWRATIQPSIEAHLSDYFRLWRLSLTKGDLVESLQLENDIHCFISERLQRLSWEFHRLRRRIGSDGNEELSEKSREERKVLKYLRDRLEREVIPEAWAIMETIGEVALLGLNPALDRVEREEDAQMEPQGQQVKSLESKRNFESRKPTIRVNSRELEIEERYIQKEEHLEAINRKLAKKNNKMIQDMLNDLTGSERGILQRTDTSSTASTMLGVSSTASNASVESLFDKWKSLPPVPEDEEETSPRIVIVKEQNRRKIAAVGMADFSDESPAKARIGRIPGREVNLRVKTRDDDGYIYNNELTSLSSRSSSRSPGLSDGFTGLKISSLDLGEKFGDLKPSGSNTSFDSIDKPVSPRPWRSMQKQFEAESSSTLSSFRSNKSFDHFDRSYNYTKPLSPVDSLSTVDSVNKTDVDATPRQPARVLSYNTPPSPLRISKDLPALADCNQTSTPPITPPTLSSSSPPQYETPRPLCIAPKTRLQALTVVAFGSSPPSATLPILPAETPSTTSAFGSSPLEPATQLQVPVLTVQYPIPSRKVSTNKTFLPFDAEPSAEALEQKSRLRPVPSRLLWEKKSDDNLEGKTDVARTASFGMRSVGAGRVKALASKWENDASSSPKSEKTV